jgi:hypothetical protein
MMPQGTARTGPWTAGEIAYLHEHNRSMTTRQIAENLNRRFCRNRTTSAVSKKITKLGLRAFSYSADKNRTWLANAEYLREQREIRASIPDSVFMDARVASIYHLVDLKRAGFRQGHGELTIPRGEGITRYVSPTDNSYMGSAADACANA